MKRNWIKKIIGGLSFTTALFVFQACYGTPQDFGFDSYVEGTVKSRTTDLPINGIRVLIYAENAINNHYLYTDEKGYFSLYSERGSDVKLRFDDADADENGLFATKDTILYDVTDKVYLNIYLDTRR